VRKRGILSNESGLPQAVSPFSFALRLVERQDVAPEV
jgi:hypothetical protein